jgi:hypothetical protein
MKTTDRQTDKTYCCAKLDTDLQTDFNTRQLHVTSSLLQQSPLARTLSTASL